MPSRPSLYGPSDLLTLRDVPHVHSGDRARRLLSGTVFLLSANHCASRRGSRSRPLVIQGLLAGYDAKPIGAGLGCDTDNPTIAQIKNHKEMRQRKSKAKTSLFATVSSSIFTRILTLKTANGIWDFLKKKYEGNERVKGMQVLNLIRELEMQRMKESETIKDYSDRLLDVVNKVRLLGTDFSDSRIVQKIFVTVPEKFEATISSIENSKNVPSINLAELLNALQA
ncbi:hypothetical protein CsSME_00007588 [Camellia sinensis var. sinensis]